MPLSLAELRALAVAHHFVDPDTAAAVAMAESGGDPAAVGDLKLGISHGLWQINLRWHPECKGLNLFDPDVNAQCAYGISRGGTYWKPWSTYNSNAYVRFMPAQERPTQPDLAPAASALLAEDAHEASQDAQAELPLDDGPEEPEPPEDS